MTWLWVMQVGNVDMLNCYYSHADSQDGLQVSTNGPCCARSHACHAFTLTHFVTLLQRRCYWLLESKDDIVLVHYLNIAQRQQAGRRVLLEDNRSQSKSEKEPSLQSDSVDPSEPSGSSDSEPAPRSSSSPPAAQGQGASPSRTAVAESCAVALDVSEELVQLIPSVSSMDMLYSVTDSKPSKLNGEEALRSNADVQELLRSWEDENQAVDLPLFQHAQDNWQVCRHC